VTASPREAAFPADATEAYEALRAHVVSGVALSEPTDLVLLLRDGVAAWMRQAARAVVRVSTTAAPASGALAAPQQIHAGIVQVLANMALAAGTEMSP
jgi:hypothetical protein